LGSLYPKSKHNVSPSSIVKDWFVVPTFGLITGGGFAGHDMASNWISLLETPTKKLFLYSFNSTATT